MVLLSPHFSIVSTSTDESAQHIEGGYVNTPSHNVNLTSVLATCSVMEGTRPTLHIKGVS